ncbi:MAG: flippase [Candidatus Coatesbacteria bacterium]|nr:flippase [Candidatus Coatesbacteria bacterium]
MSLRRLAKNVAFRTGTEAFKKLVNVAFVIFVARELGADGLGRYSFLLVLTSILGLVADCGFSTLMLREVATRRDEASRLLGAAIILKAFLSGVVFGLLWIVIGCFHSPIGTDGAATDYTEAYLFAAYSILLSFMEMFNAFFVVDQRLDLDAVTNVVQRGGAVLLGVLLVAYGWGVLGIGYAFAVATAVAAVFALILVIRRFGRPTFVSDFPLFKSMLKETVPLALTLFFSSVYFRIDQVMLGWMRTETELGWYSAAYRVFEVSALAPSILMLIALPIFSRLRQEAEDIMIRAGQQILTLLLVMGIVVSVVVTLAAPDIIVLFGKDFGSESSDALMLLMWTAIPIFCNFVLTTLLIAIGRQVALMYCFAAGAVANIALNLVMIPRWSHLGAAGATLITEVVLFALVARILGRSLPGWRLKAILLLPISTAVVAAVPPYLVGLSGDRLVFAALWTVLYLAGVVLFKTIKWSEIALLRRVGAESLHSDVGDSGDGRQNDLIE